MVNMKFSGKFSLNNKLFVANLYEFVNLIHGGLFSFSHGKKNTDGLKYLILGLVAITMSHSFALSQSETNRTTLKSLSGASFNF